jgi:hypothetical protein
MSTLTIGLAHEPTSARFGWMYFRFFDFRIRDNDRPLALGQDGEGQPP